MAVDEVHLVHLVSEGYILRDEIMNWSRVRVLRVKIETLWLVW